MAGKIEIKDLQPEDVTVDIRQKGIDMKIGVDIASLAFSNTSFSFLNGNTFSAKVNGIPFSGSYVYNPQNGEITLKTSTETLKGNVIRTQKGMGLMFNSTQMVNLLHKEGKVSNTAAIQAVSNLAKSANGARVGFELTK